MRQTTIQRRTSETDITLTLHLDGTGEGTIATGSGFLDHMLVLFQRHSGFDLSVTCHGDTEVDDHHSVEDIGICLGQALHASLGDKKGITRYGSMLLPMDEALVQCAIDLSGRSYLNFDVDFGGREKVGSFDVELVEEFFLAFTRSAQATVHITKQYGKNTHHIIEAIFKAFARTLAETVRIDERNKDRIPSTKGLL